MGALAKNSLYGPAGWTTFGKVHQILGAEEEFIFGDPSFHRFRDVGADAVRELCEVMPAANADDRQNNAPPLGQLCSACLRLPLGVTLSGYVISPPRRDERVTVDALTVRGVPLSCDGEIAVGGVSLVGDDRLKIWYQIAEYLGIDADQGNIPDEMVCLEKTSDGLCSDWWLWWD